MAAGHYSLEQVEAAIDHMFRSRVHHHLILLATLAVIVGGMVLLNAITTVDAPGSAPLLEKPLDMSSASQEYRRAWAEMPAPLDKETCYEYMIELERIVCLEKYEEVTVPWMGQEASGG